MIRKRGKNSWEVRVYLGRDPATGKKIWKYATVRGSKRDAEAVERRLLGRQERGELVAVRMTVAELLDEWLAHVRTNRERRTYDHYVYCAERIRAALGPTRLDRLSRAQIQRWLNDLQAEPRADGKPGTISQATVMHHYRALRAALSFAVKMGYLGYNPAAGVDLPRRQPKEPTVLTREQLAILLDAVRGTRWYALFHLVAHTGLRAGEVCGLWWEDIDWGKPALHVRRQLKRVAGGRPVIGDVKSHEARIVWLDRETAEVLDQHRAQVQMAMAQAPRWEHPEHVFTGPGGRRLYPTVPSQVLLKTCRRLGLPPISLHDLRHTHGSHLIQYHGWSLTAVSERLGHASPAFTAQVYAHAVPGVQKQYLGG